jgi:hypothetical protein
MKFIHLPRFTISPQVEAHVPIQRPLSTCEHCQYVLCSCGHCHSQACQEACLYETGALAEPDFQGMSDHLRQMLENQLGS